MDIKKILEKTLRDRGWTATRLAKEAGVPIPSITRILKGNRKGLHSETLLKLWPFLTK